MSDPILATPCMACGESIHDGCRESHDHNVYCWDGWSDTRALRCGCTVHKECQKSGLQCLSHITFDQQASQPEQRQD